MFTNAHNQTNQDSIMNYQNEFECYLKTLDNNHTVLARKVRNDYLRKGKTMRFVWLAFQQLNGRSISQYYYMMFSADFLCQIQEHYLWSIAEDLDNMIFNRIADDDGIQLISQYLDVDAYRRAERNALYQNRGNTEAYRNDVLHWLTENLSSLSPADLSALDNIVNRINEKGGKQNECESE